MGTDRLSRRQLNRATLARQLLLQRSPLQPVQVVEHLVGLQSQAPLAPYVALWSRVSSFDATTLAVATERGDVVRTHTFRVTVHLHTEEDARRLRLLLQPMLTRRFASTPFPRQLPGVDLDELRCLVRHLAHDAPVTRGELGRLLSEHFPGIEPLPLAYAATYLEPMVQPPPRGVWGKKGAVTWQTFDGWFGDKDCAPANVEQVVVRYIAAFGPASVPDIRVWSGLPGLQEVVDGLRSQLRVFVDPDGRQLLDLPDAPRPPGDIPAPVRFLPEYDNVLLSHQDRSRIIPDGRPVPLPPGDGARTGTFLVDGYLRGTWETTVVGEGVTLRVEASPALSAAEEAEVVPEAGKLLSFVRRDSPDARVEVCAGR